MNEDLQPEKITINVRYGESKHGLLSLPLNIVKKDRETIFKFVNFVLEDGQAEVSNASPDLPSKEYGLKSKKNLTMHIELLLLETKKAMTPQEIYKGLLNKGYVFRTNNEKNRILNIYNQLRLHKEFFKRVGGAYTLPEISG
jgi:hypothetical protein